MALSIEQGSLDALRQRCVPRLDRPLQQMHFLGSQFSQAEGDLVDLPLKRGQKAARPIELSVIGPSDRGRRLPQREVCRRTHGRPEDQQAYSQYGTAAEQPQHELTCQPQHPSPRPKPRPGMPQLCALAHNRLPR